MSILNQTVKNELPLNLKVCKRGGSDSYSNGKITAETDKAILVVFEAEKKQVWISKKNVYDNGNDYGVCAKMWNSWERVVVEDITESQKTESHD
jgi:hypothetical protein